MTNFDLRAIMDTDQTIFGDIEEFGRFVYNHRLYMKVLTDNGYHDTVWTAIELKDGVEAKEINSKTIVYPVVVTKVLYTDGECNYTA